MILTLPYPPLANRYWRKWRNRMVVSDEARAYKVSTLVRAKSQGVQLIPKSKRVSVSLTFYRQARRGDIDGGIKILLDSLQGVAFENDSQVAELHALQLEDPANPRVRICVTEWEGKAA